MANRGVKKKKNKYNTAIRIANKIRKLSKHLKKHPNCKDAQTALKKATSK